MQSHSGMVTWPITSFDAKLWSFLIVPQWLIYVQVKHKSGVIAEAE